MAELKDRHHGVTPIEVSGGVRPITDIASAIIGIVCTAEDASALAFPLNEPVGFPSLDLALAQSGDKGTLSPSLQAIRDQTDAPIVVVRVAEGKTEQDTVTNIIGANRNGRMSGLKALQKARAKTGMTPRILGVPDFNHQLITTDLATLAKQLNAFAYAPALDEYDTTKAGQYRTNFGARELMLIDDDFTRINLQTNKPERAQTIARILGMRAALDQTYGWHKSISNSTIQGVTGIEKGRSYELTSPNTEANFLNNKDITTLVRDEGFRVWGNRTTAADPLFSFEVAVRTNQMIQDIIAKAHRWPIDLPMHASLIIDIMAGIQAKLDEWTYQNKILGGSVWADPRHNTQERVGNGTFRVDYDYMYVPPLENLELAQSINGAYIIDMVNRTVSFENASQ